MSFMIQVRCLLGHLSDIIFFLLVLIEGSSKEKMNTDLS